MGRGVLPVVVAMALAGCTTFLAGPPLDACTDGVLPEGHELRVRVVWNHTGEPVAGACVGAYPAQPPVVETDARTDGGGVAVLRLPERAWHVNAVLRSDQDGLCVYTTGGDEVATPVAVRGPAEVALRMYQDRRVCV